MEDEGRGMGTLCVTRVFEEAMMDVLGEEGTERRWTGCDKGSVDDSPTRLSTDSPSFTNALNNPITSPRVKSLPYAGVPAIPRDRFRSAE